MKFSEFKKNGTDIDASWETSRSVKCNALWRGKQSINFYLTPSEAIQFARHLLEKSQFILEAKIEDAAVQIWTTGKSKTLSFGIMQATKDKRRKSAAGRKRKKALD